MTPDDWLNVATCALARAEAAAEEDEFPSFYGECDTVRMAHDLTGLIRRWLPQSPN